MEMTTGDTLAGRLERRGRRWAWASALLALALAVLVAGGLAATRSVVAQPPAARPVAPRMAYKVVPEVYLNQLEKPMQDLANDGWEVVQVVPVEWSGGDGGAYGHFSKGHIVARRPAGLGR